MNAAATDREQFALCPVCGKTFKATGLGRHRGAKRSKCQFTEDERAAMAARVAEIRRESALQWKRDHPERVQAAEVRRSGRRKRQRKRRNYCRKWRVANPTYRAEHLEQRRASEKAWREANPDKVKAQKRRWGGKRLREVVDRIAPLFPDIIHGGVISFWEDELRMELRQERELAILEGRDPNEAVRTYRAREKRWYRVTVGWTDAVMHGTGDADD